MLSQEEADKLPFDILDATKVIPEELVPIRMVGRLVLNRNPDNFFSETEQVAFLPTNVPPGIDFSEDPLLQGRLSRIRTPNYLVLAPSISTRFRSIGRRVPISKPAARRAYANASV